MIWQKIIWHLCEITRGPPPLGVNKYVLSASCVGFSKVMHRLKIIAQKAVSDLNLLYDVTQNVASMVVLLLPSMEDFDIYCA